MNMQGTPNTLFESDLRTPPPLDLPHLCLLFLRIAMASFGGYMSMVSAARQALVERRGLLQDKEVLDSMSLASLIPGPLAINVIACLGYRLRGMAGALLAVVAVTTPAFVLMILLGALYLQLAEDALPARIFAGIVPCVIAVILVAGWGMAKQAVKSGRELLITLLTTFVCTRWSAVWLTPLVLCLAGLAGAHLFASQNRTKPSLPAHTEIDVNAEYALEARMDETVNSLSMFESRLLLLTGSTGGIALLGWLASDLVFKLFITFAGMSLMLFGGAYVFIPLMQQIVVDAQGWLTQREFVDAIAMSQMMPGPVIVIATFVGYKMAGLFGALIATLAIVLPSLLLLLFSIQLLDGLRSLAWFEAVMRGLRAAVVGLIAASALSLLHNMHAGWLAPCILIASLVALLRWRTEAVWLIPFAGLAGWLAY